MLERGDDVGVGALGEAHHADTRALQAVRVEGVGIAGGAIGRHRVHHHRRAAHRARHRPGRVLRAADGHDVRLADHAHRGLEADHAVDLRGADDGAVGFRPHRARREPGRDRRAGAGRAAARAAVEHVRVADLPAHRAPAGDGGVAAEVGPLAEVRLAENDRALRAQTRDQRAVPLCHVVGQRVGAGRGGKPRILRLDIVLEQDRHAVQRAERLRVRATLIGRLGLLDGGGIEREDGLQARAAAVDGLDAVKIGLGELHGAERAVFEPGAHLGQGQRGEALGLELRPVRPLALLPDLGARIRVVRSGTTRQDEHGRGDEE